jgi:hypothetical protein
LVSLLLLTCLNVAVEISCGLLLGAMNALIGVGAAIAVGVALDAGAAGVALGAGA